jgi:mannitol/fructose-specific phosphotransferase system IIA component (Ntr-type)
MLVEVTSKAVNPITLADFTGPALVTPGLRAHDTAGVVGELSQLLQREACVPDLLPFYHTALNQELLSSSALECGIAFPHGRLSGVRHLRFAFGRLGRPINWGTGKSGPVQMVFLLAVPATDAAMYLHLLASIARLGQQPATLAALRTADSPEKILSLFGQIRMRQP